MSKVAQIVSAYRARKRVPYTTQQNCELVLKFKELDIVDGSAFQIATTAVAYDAFEEMTSDAQNLIRENANRIRNLYCPVCNTIHEKECELR